MDRTTAKLAAALDAGNARADRADIRKTARSMVRDMRARMASVEAVCGRPFRDAPERLAAWAIGHDVSVSVHAITGDAVLRLHTPTTTGGHYVTALVRTYTADHAQALRDYLMSRIDAEWAA